MIRRLGWAIVALLLLFANKIEAQSELIAGYGMFSSGEIDNTFNSSNVKPILDFSNDYKAYASGLGPWHIGFKYNFNKNLAVGVIGVVSTIRTSYFGSKLQNGLQVDSKQTVFSSQYSTMVRAYYSWIHIKNLNIYSSLACGVSYQNYKNTSENRYMNKFSVAYQANALGFRAGNRLGAFLELGYGYAGIANIGLSFYL